MGMIGGPHDPAWRRYYRVIGTDEHGEPITGDDVMEPWEFAAGTEAVLDEMKWRDAS